MVSIKQQKINAFEKLKKAVLDGETTIEDHVYNVMSMTGNLAKMVIARYKKFIYK